jgi:hypothetical protein
MRSKSILRSDLDIKGFENLVFQNAAKLKLEKAIICPCGRKDNSHSKRCANCNGTGLFFYEHPTEVWGMITSLNYNQTLGLTSEQINATANLTLSNTYDSRLQVYDKLTLLDGKGITTYQQIFPETRINNNGIEVLDVLINQPIASIENIYMFDTENDPLIQIETSDYSFVDNLLTFSEIFLQFLKRNNKENLSMSIRYNYMPVYHIIRTEHNTRQSRIMTTGGVDQVELFPLAYLIQESWYFMQNKGYENR